jgi:hypothetical protein
MALSNPENEEEKPKRALLDKWMETPPLEPEEKPAELKPVEIPPYRPIKIRYSSGYYLIDEYGERGIGGVIERLRLLGVSDEKISEFLPKIKTLMEGEELEII